MKKFNARCECIVDCQEDFVVILPFIVRGADGTKRNQAHTGSG